VVVILSWGTSRRGGRTRDDTSGRVGAFAGPSWVSGKGTLEHGSRREPAAPSVDPRPCKRSVPRSASHPRHLRHSPDPSMESDRPCRRCWPAPYSNQTRSRLLFRGNEDL